MVSSIAAMQLLFAFVLGVSGGYVFALYRRRRADAQMGRCRLLSEWFFFEVVRPGAAGLDGLVFSVMRKPGMALNERLAESQLDHVAHFEIRMFTSIDGELLYYRRRVTAEGLLRPSYACGEMHPLEAEVLGALRAHVGSLELGRQVLG